MEPENLSRKHLDNNNQSSPTVLSTSVSLQAVDAPLELTTKEVQRRQKELEC